MGNRSNEQPELGFGDEVPPETPGAGENICPECGGSGRLDGGRECPTCEGTGYVKEAVGGG